LAHVIAYAFRHWMGVASSRPKSSDPQFRVFVELGEKDKDFWESQVLGTPAGRAQLTALRTGLKEVLPSGTELSDAPVVTFFEDDAESIIAKAEPIIAKNGRRAWIVRD
jgi:hypothetical protein